MFLIVYVQVCFLQPHCPHRVFDHANLNIFPIKAAPKKQNVMFIVVKESALQQHQRSSIQVLSVKGGEFL